MRLDPQRVRDVVSALLTADEQGIRRLLETDSDILLGPAAENQLRNAARVAAENGYQPYAKAYTRYADLLAELRKRSVEAAVVGEGEAPPAALSNKISVALDALQRAVDADDAKFNPDNLNRQITLSRNLLSSLSRAKHGALWGSVSGTLANALQQLGNLNGDAGLLRLAEDANRNALLQFPRERSPTQWATVQNNLGNVLARLGDLTGDTAVMRAAEAAYRDALLERTRSRNPMDWAATQNNLGNVLQSLGERSGDTAVLRQAEHAYCDALLEFTRARSPMDWAMTQNNLGGVLQYLGELTSDALILCNAEKAFRDALCERTRERSPMDWAMTQNNLGNVQAMLGELTGNAVVLREAERAYRDASLEITRERRPMHWATTQNNLGCVLQSLGGLSGDAYILRQAEQVFRDALLERTRARSPISWAMTQHNLGNVLRRLGELTGDVMVLWQAESACCNALLEWTPKSSPLDWAMTQNNLGNVLQLLGELSGDATLLHQAMQAYRQALHVRTRRRRPTEWAMTQNNLGTVLARLGKMSGDPAVLQQAERAYRNSLLERTVDRSPMHWATTQNNLGNVLALLGNLTDSAPALRASEAAYRAALKVLDESGAEDHRQGVAATLVRFLTDRQRYSDAALVIEPTLGRSELALLDAARSHDGRARAIEVVSDLHALLSLCHLRGPHGDVAMAFQTAASGRARLLADALAFDVARVESINDPAVREDIERATDRRRQLRFQLGYERADSTSAPRELAPDVRAQLQAELHEATETWATLLRRHGFIRALPPLTPTDIRAAVPDGGALVLPMLTEHAAFAFVVSDSGAPQVVEIPGLDRRAVTAHLSGETNWLGAYDRHFRQHQGKDPAAAAAWHQELTGMLAWLWERLLGPIHAHLRDVAGLAPNAPVVLLPPGLLGLLSLHAAGPGPDGRYFGDHWTVSYAPSVRSLLTCQARRDERVTKPARLLAAIDPDGSLSGARAEGPMLRQRFAAPDREPVILTGDEATVARVLGGLSDTTVFHASTHGAHDGMEPARSGLLLADGVLELDIVRQARLDAMRLVFLSACESGLAGVRKLPEEFIGLPTGFVEAGAAAVVGSLWPIGDTSAFLLARRFYNLMFDAAGQERMAPATALRTACAWLRDVTYGELKQEFPLVQLPTGPALVLRSARMMPGPTEPEPPAPEDMHLPLGPDDERPFVHPTHWAAFACTGC